MHESIFEEQLQKLQNRRCVYREYLVPLGQKKAREEGNFRNDAPWRGMLHTA